MSKHRKKWIASLTVVLLVELVFAIIFHNDFSIPIYSFPTINSPYFSLGDAVAALALVFAVYQLSDSTWALVLNIKGRFQKNLVWLLVGLGLVFALISSLISEQYTKGKVISNPLFWQILAFITFASAPFTLRYVGTSKKNMFSPKKAKSFYNHILETFSSDNPVHTKNAVDIVMYNLDALMSAIRSYLNDVERKVIATTTNVDENDTPETDYRLYASALLETAFSDDRVASYIATQRIDFIWNYVRYIENNKLTKHELGDSFKGIVEQLFNNKESYLFRQKQYKGISKFAPVNDLIFGNPYLAKNFSPIRSWSIFGVDEIIMIILLTI